MKNGQGKREFQFKGRPVILSPLTISEGAYPLSFLFYCAYCGDVYCRVRAVREGGKESKWLAFTRVCEACAPKQMYFSEHPGSIWLSYDPDYLTDLPFPILQRELQLAITNFQKYGGFKHD